MKLTRDQLRAVETEGRDLVVLAGAGSGKTAVLIERVRHLVTKEARPHELARILAITFTQKAAREMKQRLARVFAESGQFELREQVEWAHVSTIHSFCARVLRENAVEAGVDPAFEVLEQAAADALLRDALTDASRRWSATEGEMSVALTRVCGTNPNVSILGAYQRLRGAGVDPVDLRVPEHGPGGFDPSLRAILDALDLLPPLLDEETPTGRMRAEAALLRRPDLEALPGADPTPEQVRAVLFELGKSIDLRGGRTAKEVLRRIREELIPVARDVVAEAFAAPGLQALKMFLAEFHRGYSGRKRGLGALDFNDLEVMTRRLLEESEGVRQALAGRYTQVLVDEYQDVNPVQAAILGLIRRPGNHFAVGDVKQSIYGFRYSDPEIFRALSDEVGREGRVGLSTNFRSAPALVDFANHCFRELFKDQPLVDWADMTMPEGAGAEEGEVEILLLEEGNANEVRIAEARAMAEEIRAAAEREDYRFGDVAILFRALTNVKIYERALEEAEVPYYVVKGRGFFEAREVIDLVRLLECVRNPRDQFSFAAALRSPFCGQSEDGLLALATAARESGGVLADLLGTAEAVAGLGREDQRRWIRFAAMLTELRALAGRSSLRDLIETALTRSGYGTAVWMLPSGRRRAANLRKVLELADSLGGMFDLEEFIGHLEESRMREVQETEAPTGGEEENVVRLLTVHGAKGLQFPVVFLPNLGRSPNWPVPDLLFENGELAVRVVAGVTREKLPTPRWREFGERQVARERAENLRLLYVGVTRAERRLILCAAEGRPRTDTWWERLESVLDVGSSGAPYGCEGRQAAVRRPETATPSSRAMSTILGGRESLVSRGRPLGEATEVDAAWAGALLDKVRRKTEPLLHASYQNTVSELLLFSHCECCYRRRYLLGVPRSAERAVHAAHEEARAAGGSDELPPSERGNLAHELLRVFDPRGTVTLAEAVDSLVAKEDLRLRRDLMGMVEGFYAGEIGTEVLAAPSESVKRETPFLTRWRTGGDSDLLLRGQIDLMYRRPNGAMRVVDYKTGVTPSSAYEVQLVVYAMALERFLPGPMDDPCFVYLRPDGDAEVVPVSITAGLREHVEDLASRFARTLAAGGPEAREHAPGCYR